MTSQRNEYNITVRSVEDFDERGILQEHLVVSTDFYHVDCLPLGWKLADRDEPKMSRSEYHSEEQLSSDQRSNSICSKYYSSETEQYPDVDVCSAIGNRLRAFIRDSSRSTRRPEHCYLPHWIRRDIGVPIQLRSLLCLRLVLPPKDCCADLKSRRDSHVKFRSTHVLSRTLPPGHSGPQRAILALYPLLAMSSPLHLIDHTRRLPGRLVLRIMDQLEGRSIIWFSQVSRRLRGIAATHIRYAFNCTLYGQSSSDEDLRQNAERFTKHVHDLVQRPLNITVSLDSSSLWGGSGGSAVTRVDLSAFCSALSHAVSLSAVKLDITVDSTASAHCTVLGVTRVPAPRLRELRLQVTVDNVLSYELFTQSAPNLRVAHLSAFQLPLVMALPQATRPIPAFTRVNTIYLSEVWVAHLPAIGLHFPVAERVAITVPYMHNRNAQEEFTRLGGLDKMPAYPFSSTLRSLTVDLEGYWLEATCNMPSSSWRAENLVACLSKLVLNSGREPGSQACINLTGLGDWEVRQPTSTHMLAELCKGIMPGPVLIDLSIIDIRSRWSRRASLQASHMIPPGRIVQTTIGIYVNSEHEMWEWLVRIIVLLGASVGSLDVPATFWLWLQTDLAALTRVMRAAPQLRGSLSDDELPQDFGTSERNNNADVAGVHNAGVSDEFGERNEFGPN